jgi:hypothetical protein
VIFPFWLEHLLEIASQGVMPASVIAAVVASVEQSGGGLTSLRIRAAAALAICWKEGIVTGVKPWMDDGHRHATSRRSASV